VNGILVEDSVLETYHPNTVASLIKKLVPSDSQMNKTFHKSWKKVRDASIEQLVIEQIIHYFTTYGFEEIGFYNAETVYIPNEKLELEAKGGITFYVLRGITREEMAVEVDKLISSGMALSENDIDDLMVVIKEQKLAVDPDTSKNRELTVRLYKFLNITPKDPVEYLRLQVYNITGNTLLIKNPEMIKALSAVKGINVFKDYEDQVGLEKLAAIFNRFKPLFLAFKNKESSHTINRIRKLAKKHHKPVPEDYMASVTKHVRNGTFEASKLNKVLKKANVFRKIKLAQALRFYDNEEVSGVVYAIRNGKSYASTINKLGASAKDALSVVMDSLGADIKHLKGKKIFIDAGLVVPTSGKMFMGAVPFGSYFSTTESLVLGVSWKDVGERRVDLDLSMMSVGQKIGWDSHYRDSTVLFSGDVTSAPHGATEAHLVRNNAENGIYLLNLNYFNGYGEESVPFTLFVTKENEYQRMDKHAVMSQDNMLFWAEGVIEAKHKQKTIGVLKIRNGIKQFHVFEFKTGKGITARNDDKNKNTISYYDKYLDALLDVQTLVEWSGAKMVDTPDEADIDLSLKSLTKNVLLDLLVK